MKEFVVTFLKVYGIGFGVILLLVLVLAYENLHKFEPQHIAVVLIGTILSTGVLVYLSVKEDKDE